MRQIEHIEMQQIELHMLKVFDTLCKNENLRYYIDGGTLLGAMCYEGFIPWDDDIDIKMPRPDYERLCLIKEKLPANISLMVPSIDFCEYTMSKLIDNRTILIENRNGMKKKTGVYIDILPMDGHPDNNESHFKKLQKYNSMFHYSINGFDELRKSNILLTKMKGYIYNFMYTPWKLLCKMNSLAKHYKYDENKYVGLVIEGDYRRERFLREQLDNCVYLKFEDMTVPAPADYEKHIQQFYGSHINKKEHYHNLPYIKPSHDYEVYWKD